MLYIQNKLGKMVKTCFNILVARYHGKNKTYLHSFKVIWHFKKKGDNFV